MQTPSKARSAAPQNTPIPPSHPPPTHLHMPLQDLDLGDALPNVRQEEAHNLVVGAACVEAPQADTDKGRTALASRRPNKSPADFQQNIVNAPTVCFSSFP